MITKIIKNFSQWFTLKPELDENKVRPLFQEREIWMAHIGSNIRFEIDGKSVESLRPIVVFKKLSKNTMMIIPLTTSLKSGTWYSQSNIKGVEGRYCLNQIRMIDAKRLKYRIERINQDDFEKLKSDFRDLIE
jgi:mRNA-degrading endonuclease toxin of MazEF toxin-antitoxin module